MEEFIIMLRNVLMFVALAIPGFIMVKVRLLKPEQSGVLSKLLMYLALPFMIFSGVVKNLTFDGAALLTLGLVALIGVAVVLGMFFISAPLVKMEKNKKTAGIMRFCAVFANNGFLGIPLAVAAKTSFAVPSAAMTVHPVRMSGTVIAAPQTYNYFDRLQERIVEFVTANSRISRKDFLTLMLKTGEMSSDVGSVLYGREAVTKGIIDRVGGLSDALTELYRLIDETGGEKKTE